MTGFDELMGLPEGMTGDVRLFPLPNLVMFPHVVQPLHIFEPRYCDLLEDALAGDHLIATALLEPGWEADYDGRPPIASTVCIGQVVSHAREGDRRHNILLLGARRGRVRRELATGQSFRQAEVRFLDDYYAPADADQRRRLKRQLLEMFRARLPKTQPVQEQFDQLLSSHVPLGVLTDVVAYTVGLELRVKQQLLEQLNVDRRAALLLERLRSLQASSSSPRAPFPPEFSQN